MWVCCDFMMDDSCGNKQHCVVQCVRSVPVYEISGYSSGECLRHCTVRDTVNACVCVFACVFVSTYMCVNTNMCVCVCIRVCLCVCIYACTCASTYVHTCKCQCCYPLCIRCSVLESPTSGIVQSDTLILRGTGGQRTLHAVL